jgi:hypothetical protein
VDTKALKRLLWWCTLVLRVASSIVPRRQRREWLREWQGEVWHWANFLVESERLNPHTEHELLRHCWGSFGDALWHRFNRVAVLDFMQSYPLTPSFCLVMISAALLALLAAGPISLSSWTFAPPPHVDSSHLLIVSPNVRGQWLEPEVLRDCAMRWTRSNQLIAQATTYAWRPSLVRGPEGKESVLSARVTPGTLELLGGNPILGRTFESTDSSHCESCVVLSNSLWRTEFHGDSGVIGQPLYLNGRRLEIVGVLPAQFRFPGLAIGLYTPFGMGFHPRLPHFEWSGALLFVPAGTAVAQNQVQSYINQAGGLPSDIKVDVLSLTDLEYQALESCAVLILLAVLLVLSLNWRSVAGLHVSGAYRRLPEFWRWWLFFIIKSTLLLIAVLIASLELVQMVVAALGVNGREYAGGTVMWLFLVGLTVALTWSIRDQRSRCRTCLKRLKMQIALGNSVGAFCEPSGLDVVCDGGHGVLHVPVMHLSSLDSERWTNLDESWREIAGAQLGASVF